MPFKINTCHSLLLWLFLATFFFPSLHAQDGRKKESQSILTDVPLPLNAPEVFDFMGFYSKTKQQVTLSWETGDEKGCKNFLIERHNAVEDKWDILGFVTAKGKAAIYAFNDPKPLPLNYYRMRGIDKVGKPTLLKTTAVSKDDVGKLKVYPKSVKDSLLNIVGIEIAEDSLKNETVQPFSIFNMLYQKVIQGKTKAQIDVSHLPIGVYFIKIGDEKAKFLKQ